MLTSSQFILPQLTPWHRKKFLKHATAVLEAQKQTCASKEKNILHYILKEQTKYERMRHYPKGDRIDKNTGSQYFYHCHRENFTSQEHGHFHCFLRYKQIPKRIKPTPLTDWNKYIDNPMTHLVAIGMNQYGQPIRLFTVNRWVTSEIWYDAQHIHYFIKRYQINLTGDLYWQILDKWVEAMLHLFTPQIIWLHQERDKIMQQQTTTNPYIDFDLEELSTIPIDLKSQIEWVLAS